MEGERTIKVRALTRVEGEGGLYIRLRQGRPEEVQLNIYEPPRLFEALLRGRKLEDVPDITARICGICPVAYQMSSVHALEAALGVQISPELRRLRRLLYCGEWIESHALHIHLLHVPDFLGYDSALSLAKDQPDAVARGLRLKKYGNELLEVLGGRAIHPINVAVGGFYRLPRKQQLQGLIPHFEQSLVDAVDAARWIAGFDFPDFQQPYDFVAISHPDEYAMNEGDVRTSDGQQFSVADYPQHFREQQKPHSTALHTVRTGTSRPYLVGPMARLRLNGQQLFPTARRLADELGFDGPCHNPFKSILARCVELVHAFEEALQILRDYHPSPAARITYAYRQAAGAAATEAPRGLLYHRYEIDSQGTVTQATIVPPTSQNQAQIEVDLRSYLPQVLERWTEDVAIGEACERLVRSYDPCISCATHFLKVRLERS